MKIVSVEKKGDYYARVTFERDGEQVSKHVRLSDCARKVLKSESFDYNFMWEFQKAAREADRDIAYRKHGAAFREHCEFNSNFFSLLPPEELEKLVS